MKIAIIGFGAMGKNHYRVLGKFGKEVNVIAIAEPKLEEVNRSVPEFAGAKVSSYLELPEKPDAVVIASPTSQHSEQAGYFLREGVDVLLEKPIAAEEDQAAELVRIAAQSRRVLAVNHIERCNPAVDYLIKNSLNPLYADIQRLGSFSPRSLDVDVLQDLMIHDIDILLQLDRSGVKEIRAVGVPVISQKVDIANVRLEFSSGFVATVTASRTSQSKIRKMRLFQKSLYVSLDYQLQEIKLVRLQGVEVVEDNPIIEKREPLLVMWKRFLDSVRIGKNLAVGGEEAAAALGLINSIRKEMKVVKS